MDNICKSCRFATSDLRCNRLLSTCIGRSDRLGSDYKKNNECPYYKEGTPRNEEKRNINFFNPNDMKQLSEYTDDELRAELKRRAQGRKKNQKHEIVYVEFDATIACVDNTMGYKSNGDVRYKPFVFWKYIVKDCSYEFARRNKHIDVFYLKQGFFKRDNAPQVGDRVRLRYRRTKGSEIFDFQKAKIIQILKED